MKIEHVSVIITFLTPALVYFFRDYLIDYIKSSLTKDIEKFKHELDISKEVFRSELASEALKSSTLYNNKQKYYPEIYEKIRITEGAVLSLRGPRFELTFEDYIKTDFYKYFDNNEIFTDKEKQDFFLTWEENKSLGIKLIKKQIRIYDFRRTERLIAEVRNVLILKRLYISKEVSLLCDELVKQFVDYKIDVEFMKEVPQPPEHFKKIDASIEKLLIELESKMRIEIFGK